MHFKFVLAAFIGILLAGSAEAGKGGKKSGKGLSRIDSDKDGFVSKEEFQVFSMTKGVKKPEKKFANLDTNHDGKISQQEFASAKEAKSKKKSKG